MRYYPVFLNLEKKHCLVVGAGEVGRRKAQSLLDSGAGGVTVIDTADPGRDMAWLLECGKVRFERREFRESDLDGVFMVIASTSNHEVNQRIGALCDERGILCNIADLPEQCSFIVPASIRRGDLTVAISTAGSSPALAKRIRRELQESFGDEYAQLLSIMGALRPMMLGLGLETKENTAVFRQLANSNLLEVLASGDLDAAAEILKETLPPSLHDNIPELLNGIV
ncbi:precorrin-2 dehydrogenase/sirohydrochlorin ferrochelatase family protein [Salidesulfovibrio onnuriiensis]|uniref:precorrin-2 dehydrogenase/sirohydrochlorin ferrochelatase family protein n=1 Tax=Salidesulfovibrio onnuriiensis TaxID=2583823 RepID=UPI0011C91F1F|nr:bifunctional precorrin-2 dehydrogenase/sirohydrochlorin ferrochelatase [Salidesulfovibrio onnuriiensis]